MRYEADPDLRRVDDGRVVIGGSPLTILRLSANGALLLDRLLAGDEPVGVAAERFASRLVDRGLLLPRPPLDPDPSARRDVTVVVPVRDRADELDRCLAALDKGGAPCRIVVVDDGSRDLAAVAAVAERYGAEVIRCETSEGPAAARNTGLAVATTEWVAFVDSDVEVGDDWLVWLIRHGRDPAVGLVAPRVVPGELRRGASVWRRYEQVRSALDLGSRPGLVRSGSRRPYVPAATVLVRTEALRAIGGFDSSLRLGEDVDAVWRLVEAGWRCWYVGDEAWVEHSPRDGRGGGLGGGLRQRFEYGTSAAGLDARHPGAVTPVAVSGWSVAVWGAAAIGHPLVGLAIAAGTSLRLARRLDFLEHPEAEAARLAGRGHLGAGELLGRAVVRPWWPVALVASLFSRRARRVVVAAAVVPPLLSWRRERPALDPVRFVACHLVDDVAYSSGVWVGALRARSWGALAPRLRAWPGST